MEKKLRMTPEQVLEQAKQSVRFARNLCGDVEFSPEDGYRSDLDFLCRVLEAVIAEGATTINVPDTVGYAMPELYGNFIKTLRERVPNSDKAIWSVHCHNDLGMAVANSLAGVKIGGARQVECTINGLGERAGNCSLEEVVMAVKTRRDYFGLDVDIDTKHIVPASRMVSQTTGFVVQPNKAVVGANAFAHASGHPPGRRAQGARHLRDHARRGRGLERQQDRAGQARRAATPSSSGCRSWACSSTAKPRSTPPSPSSRNWPTARARSSTRTSWRWSATRRSRTSRRRYRLVSLSQHSETGERPHAVVVFTADGKEVRGESDGNGPVDASLKAIECHVQERRGDGAVFGQRHQRLDREPGRSDRAAAELGPRGQRRRGRPGHRGGVGQGLPQCAQQVTK